ncbi:MAG: class C beta-lactamase-related serine hydrolase [Phenylobacterium sp.]|uniref:serine hydrolase domain-containing protein n=1 Tax=Phenylobacterium sp. TaxID=1871053 RepID=UPI00120677B3|nr:serine hydrolase [Phenylobacterium sp.]TAJ70797.1 MAG: class C beta-lactamase-related serine hydrolase [Phenylobacterium sp.]
MTLPLSRRGLMAGAGALVAAPAMAAGSLSAAMQDVIEYVQGQKTTGFLVIQDRKTLAERNWPLPADAGQFRATAAYETTSEGALLEDVASQQKSFAAVLAAIAVDKGMLDVETPVSDYVGAGWSKASPEQERAIRVVHLLTMNSGLGEKLDYLAPPGSVFFYNTPAYAVTKRVLAAAARQPLETITHDWLTAPAGMTNTAWRKRPAAFGDVGNPTGLVTSPRDAAAFGQLVLDDGRARSGKRIVSEAGLKAIFARSRTNPAYGRLWWLNGSAYAIRPLANRTEGPLIPAAPADLVVALGALDRKLYVVPGKRLVVVRMGQAAPDKDFDQQLWLRLSKAIV